MIRIPVQNTTRRRHVAGRTRWLLACALTVVSFGAIADSSLPLPTAPAGSPFASWSYSHEQLAKMVPAPRPEDVADPAAIVRALHEAVNGPKGHWNGDRFRSLYLPNAVLTDVAKPDNGAVVIENRTLADLMKDVQDVHDKSAWYEKITKIESVEQFTKHGGRLAIVRYHGIAGESLDKPVEDGESMALLMNDGQRWWVVTDAW